MKRDVFVCHASEDKELVVRPLVEALSRAGISCWYDEAEIQWGDSIPQRINQGLSCSRYVIVVLSAAFLAKPWPQRELNAVLNTEASSGEVHVLPLLVGDQEDRKAVHERFPLLTDKLYLSWDGDPRRVVQSIAKRIGGHGSGVAEVQPERPTRPDSGIPIPSIPKQFTQRDKDLFLRNAFAVVKQYFAEALAQLDAQYPNVDIDLIEPQSFQFLSTVYIDGEVASRCRIWIGDDSLRESVVVQYGRSDVGPGSFNDWLSVRDDGRSLGFKPSGMYFSQVRPQSNFLTTEQLAEYLWRCFSEDLARR